MRTFCLSGKVRTSSEFPGGAPPASQEVLHQTFKRGSELCLQTSGSSSGCKRVGCRYTIQKRPGFCAKVSLPTWELARSRNCLLRRCTFHKCESVTRKSVCVCVCVCVCACARVCVARVRCAGQKIPSRPGEPPQKHKDGTANCLLHLERQRRVLFCRRLWTSRDCSSATKTTFLTSISTSTSACSTRSRWPHEAFPSARTPQTPLFPSAAEPHGT